MEKLDLNEAADELFKPTDPPKEAALRSCRACRRKGRLGSMASIYPLDL